MEDEDVRKNIFHSSWIYRGGINGAMHNQLSCQTTAFRFPFSNRLLGFVCLLFALNRFFTFSNVVAILFVYFFPSCVRPLSYFRNPSFHPFTQFQYYYFGDFLNKLSLCWADSTLICLIFLSVKLSLSHLDLNNKQNCKHWKSWWKK